MICQTQVLHEPNGVPKSNRRECSILLLGSPSLWILVV